MSNSSAVTSSKKPSANRVNATSPVRTHASLDRIVETDQPNLSADRLRKPLCGGIPLVKRRLAIAPNRDGPANSRSVLIQRNTEQWHAKATNLNFDLRQIRNDTRHSGVFAL